MFIRIGAVIGATSLAFAPIGDSQTPLETQRLLHVQSSHHSVVGDVDANGHPEVGFERTVAETIRFHLGDGGRS